MTTMKKVLAMAIEGLDVRIEGGVAVVRDGHDTWVCTEIAWRAAALELEKQPFQLGQENYVDDAEVAHAYALLCKAIKGPIASLNGECRGDWRVIVSRAIERGLIEESHGLAKALRINEARLKDAMATFERMMAPDSGSLEVNEWAQIRQELTRDERVELNRRIALATGPGSLRKFATTHR